MRESKRTSIWKKMKRYRLLYAMLLPGLIYLIVNNYMPMIGIIIAFKKIDYSHGILGGGEWIGFDNFKYLFMTSDAWVITRNTISYNSAFILINTVVAVSVAILLNEVRVRFFARIYQGVILLPFLISMVIVAYIVLALLSSEDGLINHRILPILGLDEISWYTEAKYWPYILTLVNIWKGVGYSSIIFFAALLGINEENYEAAMLDGASKMQQIRHVTIPLLMPTISILTILAIGRIFYSDFGLFYQVPLNSGMLQPTTDVIDTYVFRGLMTLGDLGMSSAAGLYQSVVGFVLILITNYMVGRKNQDRALF